MTACGENRYLSEVAYPTGEESRIVIDPPKFAPTAAHAEKATRQRPRRLSGSSQSSSRRSPSRNSTSSPSSHTRDSPTNAPTSANAHAKDYYPYERPDPVF